MEVSPALIKAEMLKREMAKKSFVGFAKYMQPDLSFDRFHTFYYTLLDKFAHGEIKKLIITCPPQHGKSQGSTRMLPAFLHGLNPNINICIASYGFPLAEGFMRNVKSYMAERRYSNIFPDTILPKTEHSKKFKGEYDPSICVSNARNYQLIKAKGGLVVVGRGGALTGRTVDIGIVDDLYKDDTEANSPLIREAAWNWYVDVFATRLSNNSQQLITFTRWHEDDVIGRLKTLCEKEKQPFYEITEYSQLENTDPTAWYLINFEAVKEGAPTEIDPRQVGEALWPERHNAQRLLEQRKLDPARFQSLYQGNPMPTEGLLYTRTFPVFRKIPSEHKGNFLYCDVADKGEDYLCSIAFVKTMKNKLLCHDILYTQEGTEVTEALVAEQIIRNNVKSAWIEANSGGAIFSRNVKAILAAKKHVCYIYDVVQAGNKESRILTNAVDVMEHVEFEEDWAFLYPEFYRDVKGFRKLFKANKHDDAVDCLTGLTEQAVLGKSSMFMYE